VLEPRAVAPNNGYGTKRLLTRLAARRRRTQLQIGVLQVGGVSIFLVLIGLPFAVAVRGRFAFLFLACVLLAASALQVAVTYAALKRAGLSRQRALARAAPIAWPFTATRAPEIVHAQVVEGAPRMVVLYAFLGETTFLQSFRSLIYDMLTASAQDSELEIIEGLCGRAGVLESIRTPPIGANHQPYCPRCATVFRRASERCCECGTALLVDDSA
jgi:hypothetical protein